MDSEVVEGFGVPLGAAEDVGFPVVVGVAETENICVGEGAEVGATKEVGFDDEAVADGATV